ncbi:MAG: hypothetical protein IIA68_02080 [Proteobacteria bacterium]|nr:hypothetical protein [Pseudomonadota bacterium]
MGSSLLMSGGAEFGEVILVGAKIGGQLDMSGSKFTGKLNMEAAEIGGYLLMSDGQFDEPVSLIFATIDSGLNLSGATVASLDMTGTRVNGELHLGSGNSPAVAWRENSRLILRNTVVEALQDREESWKGVQLELDGFTYSRLGGFGAEAGRDLASRKAQWFIDWLAKDESFSPQPYQQLASVLRAAGQTTKANAVLYAGRERERGEAQGRKRLGMTMLSFKWLVMTMLMVTIGYGLGGRYFRALWWVAGFVLLGLAILSVVPWPADIPQSKDIFWIFACSLDLLLPIVELNKEHSTFVMETLGSAPATAWVKYYFYVHKIVGWVLGSFLIAGLAGLTQK